jgi:predicted MFS family arabinose efflux permease
VVDRSAPDRRARSVAGFAACWELGVGVGAILMGQIGEGAGFTTMFLVVASFPVLGLSALGRLRTRRP